MYDVIWYPSLGRYIVQHTNLREESRCHTRLYYKRVYRGGRPSDYYHFPCLMGTFNSYSRATETVNYYPTRGAYV